MRLNVTSKNMTLICIILWHVLHYLLVEDVSGEKSLSCFRSVDRYVWNILTNCKNSTARHFPGEWSIDLWHCKSGIAVVKPRRHYTRRPLYNLFIITHSSNLCAHREPKKGVVIAAEKKNNCAVSCTNYTIAVSEKPELCGVCVCVYILSTVESTVYFAVCFCR